jgi:hypothetical protein
MLMSSVEPDAEAPQVNPMPRLKRLADVADGDYYPTAPYLTLALLAVEQFEGEIGEFACGQGHIAETLRRTIPNPILASDKFYRGYGHGGIALERILQAKGEKAVANTITNPPYARGLIEDFIETCVKLSRRKCALLMRLGALEGAKRHRLYQRYPFSRVHVFSDRPTFMPNRVIHPGELVDGKRVEGSIAYAWYVWDAAHTGEPIVRWISPQITESLQARSKEITADLEGRYALAA